MQLDRMKYQGSWPRLTPPSYFFGRDRSTKNLLPTKLLEAMAAGRPVIASADGLTARILTEAQAGYVAPAEEAAELARAIERCHLDLDRSQRGVAGQNFVAKDYERTVVLDRLTEILRFAAAGT